MCVYSTKLKMFMDSAKFGGFATVFSCSYKLILCLMRKMGYLNDRINAPIAGFLSALSLGLEAKGRKNLIMILVLTRAVDSSINLVESTGIKTLDPRWKYALVFVAVNLYLQSRMGFNQSILSRPMAKFYSKWSQMTKNDALLTQTWEKMFIHRVPYF